MFFLFGYSLVSYTNWKINTRTWKAIGKPVVMTQCSSHSSAGGLLDNSNRWALFQCSWTLVSQFYCVQDERLVMVLCICHWRCRTHSGRSEYFVERYSHKAFEMLHLLLKMFRWLWIWHLELCWIHGCIGNLISFVVCCSRVDEVQCVGVAIQTFLSWPW